MCINDYSDVCCRLYSCSFLIPADAMAEFLPNPDESSVRIYVPGPPTFILDGQTTFQLIWAEYLTYTPQESMDAFFRSLNFTQQILGEQAQDDFWVFYLSVICSRLIFWTK